MVASDVDEIVEPGRSMQAGRTPPLPYRLRAVYGVLSATNIYVPGIPPDEREIVLDLSHWNGVMDMLRAKAAGAKAVWNKATESNWWKDATYLVNRDKCFDVDMPFGGYHFLRPTPTGNFQAGHYLSVTDNEALCVLPNIIDVEVAMLASVIRAYVEYFFSIRGYYPIIYTSNYCWSLVNGATDKAWLVEHCHLFVAHWGAINPLLPYGWTSYDIHQFSANGNGRAAEFGSTGGDLDMDLSYVRKTWLAQYVKPAPPTDLALHVADLERRMAILESYHDFTQEVVAHTH